MNKALMILLALLLILTGCATTPKDTLMQVSTIDALLAGIYDGQITLGELKQHGDLGIGTFDALEGEMIVIDGTVYQAKADGTVKAMPDDATTPFAAVVQFEAELTANLDIGTDYSRLKTVIDELVPNQNLFVAIRFDDHFQTMKVRSVPKQEKPYPPLAEVVKQQAVFELKDVSGTVLGFRCPTYVKGINVPGYHLHFISSDRTTGGHILDFQGCGGMVQVDNCNRFLMILTENDGFASADLSQDRSHELEKVER